MAETAEVSRYQQQHEAVVSAARAICNRCAKSEPLTRTLRVRSRGGILVHHHGETCEAAAFVNAFWEHFAEGWEA